MLTRYQRSLLTQMSNIMTTLQSDWSDRCHKLPCMTNAERNALERKYNKIKERWNKTFQQA